MILQPVTLVPEESLLVPEEDDLQVPVEELSGDEVVPEVEKPAILAELVIEEVSIDGMCGVY